MRHVKALDEIPLAVKEVTPELTEAFAAVLKKYFGEYPADDVVSDSAGNHGSANKWRESALAARDHPEVAAYYACDTGVPNELILGAYALLFL